MSKKQEVARDQLSVRRILTDGSLLSAVQGSIIVASLYYNAEIWHDDYPLHIQEKAAPMSDAAKSNVSSWLFPFSQPCLACPSLQT